MQRRTFFRLAGLGTTAALGGPLVRGADAPVVKAGCVAEAARELPVAGAFDVIVCGAGPAGVAAALASARRGAKTQLIEVHGCLGGIWTAGLLSWILDASNKTGIMAELWKELEKRGARDMTSKGKGTNAYDTEAMKLLLEDLCADAGVVVRLHTRVCAALKNSAGRIEHAITESKSGRETWRGKVFVDCTGEGDLAAQAGCGFDLGHPETKLTQPMTLMALVTGLVPSEITEYYHSEETAANWNATKDKLRADMERGGHSPSYAKPTLFHIRGELFALMTNHEYGVLGTSAADITRATLHARKEIDALLDGLRGLGGIWKNLRIVVTAEQIGIREGRRIHGLYTVTADDLREGRRHTDAVCRATFGIDVHATDPKKEKSIEKAGFRAKAYDIPLRALIAKDVGGLMMAGRNISGDFLAHASYRVTGNSVALGEAAGRVAATAAKTSRLPQDVKLEEAG